MRRTDLLPFAVVVCGLIFVLAALVAGRAVQPQGRCSAPTLPLFHAPPRMTVLP